MVGGVWQLFASMVVVMVVAPPSTTTTSLLHLRRVIAWHAHSVAALQPKQFCSLSVLQQHGMTRRGWHPTRPKLAFLAPGCVLVPTWLS
jgi:hypothetical protein